MVPTRVSQLMNVIKKTRLSIYNYAKSQNRRLFAFLRSVKHRVVIIIKTLKAIFQLIRALEKLIEETETAKEKLISIQVQTSQLYVSYNHLKQNITEIGQKTGISVLELDMNKLPTRKTLGL